MKNYQKTILTFIIAFILIAILTISNAASVDRKELEEFLTKETSVDLENMTDADIITLYEELSEKYTNEELADIVDSYSQELKKEGISEDTIKTGTTILRTTDTEELKQILKEDIDIDAIKAKLESGQTVDEVMDDMQVDTASIFIKLLLANSIFKTIMIITLVIALYMIIIRGLIYAKAKRHAWATIIPIYRDVVWLKIAGISPWVLLLWLIPVIGWLILAIIMIISKFKVAKAFGESGWFGLGIWIIPIIFESIIAFDKDMKYEGIKKK